MFGSMSVRNGEAAATNTTRPKMPVEETRARVIADGTSRTISFPLFRTDTMTERNSHKAVTIQTVPATQYSTSAGFQ